MIRINGLKLPLEAKMEDIEKAVIEKLKVRDGEIKSIEIFKESIDARRNEIKLVYTVDVEFNDEKDASKFIDGKTILRAPNLNYEYVKADNKKLSNPPVIVGFGPAGMYTALTLAQMGLRPIVIERGQEVETRTNAVNEFWESGKLNTESNVQFGEGGAGTFSDGKLTTRIKDVVRCRKVLKEFVENGAPEDILYKQKPHIGTDILKKVVKSIREEIISLGGEIRFNAKLTGINLTNNTVDEIEVNNSEKIKTENLVLAIGHSARDTYEMLYKSGIDMVQKSFAVGVRIEHHQDMIDKVQYGKYAGNKVLGAADYALTHHAKNGRAVYTFCMCPGGEVIAASSEDNMLVTNGMSYRDRSGKNANSALLVEVKPEDFNSDSPLAGIEFQRNLEKAAYKLGGGDYKAPIQLVGDLLRGKKTRRFGNIQPTYKPGFTPADFRECFPSYIIEAMKEALPVFDNKLRGFISMDAVMTGVETRSSSPLRIVRNEAMESSMPGVYPIGEGAGYAGGIVSSAVDGIKCAEMIGKKYL